MKFGYPAKIILAWGEAISGNKEIKQWLMENDYPELGLFVHALYNQAEPRKWLLENGYPHLMALINGAEGNPNAILWLRKHGMDILEKMRSCGSSTMDIKTWLSLPSAFEN
jgi:hypothetical protein